MNAVVSMKQQAQLEGNTLGQALVDAGAVRLEGVVTSFSHVLGIGRVHDNDGKEYFFHVSDVPIRHDQIRLLFAGERVTFLPVRSDRNPSQTIAKAIQAKGGIAATMKSGSPLMIPEMVSERTGQVQTGHIKIVLTEDGIVTPHQRGAKPLPGYKRYELEGVTYFPVGGMVSTFGLHALWNGGVVMILDDKSKAVKRHTARVDVMDLILTLTKSGMVQVFRIGRRHERVEGADVNYVVIESRLKLQINSRDEKHIRDELFKFNGPLVKWDVDFAPAIAAAFAELGKK